ncbi:MAG: argininosuccinate lyase [Ferrovibrio sp.]|uniref:argininosuccinate lyase n=1 Tax=Ferrovibrio sp. TaxID=1917215 RepID=UPI00262CCC81|nr:argininosuccinate lyase [Ferrovibrio sp.]MCW0236018.1 argininosuccinate lyase [Ferrovibrio sp.]
MAARKISNKNKTPRKQANSMWGGRFAAGPAAIMTEINASIRFDRRLYRQDIRGSLAHCRMLVRQGLISAAEGKRIQAGLETILREIEAGKFRIDPALEDIHMHVEARLAELIGKPAGRLHTARSRNDQVATDFRLWVRDAIDRIDAGLLDLQQTLLRRAEDYAATVMPGFTHLQAAQPVTFGHHLLAYVEMVGRDRGRLNDARARLNESPLGAAALAGTSLPIDRESTAKELGFARPMANSLDAVADRDYALEFLSAAAICAVHLSRLAEEIVIWTSAQFRFITLSDAFTTGSSIMPQKRNPDAAELVRGKVGRIVGSLNALLITMKGLPMTYGKDMQEDKEPTFDAVDSLELCIAATAGMIADLKANAARMQEAAGEGYTTATDLADWCVRRIDMPFRQAHHVAGSLVKIAEQQGKPLEALTLAEMQSVEKRITKDIFAVLGVQNSVKSRVSYGGTAPGNVRKQVARWRRQLAQDAKKRDKA